MLHRHITLGFSGIALLLAPLFATANENNELIYKENSVSSQMGKALGQRRFPDIAILDRYYDADAFQDALAEGKLPELDADDPRVTTFWQTLETQDRETQSRLSTGAELALDPHEEAALQAEFDRADKTALWEGYVNQSLSDDMLRFLEFKFLKAVPQIGTRDACFFFVEGRFFRALVFGSSSSGPAGASLAEFNPAIWDYEVTHQRTGEFIRCHDFLEEGTLTQRAVDSTSTPSIATRLVALTSADETHSILFEWQRFGGPFKQTQTLLSSNLASSADLFQTETHTFLCHPRVEFPDASTDSTVHIWSPGAGFLIHHTQPTINSRDCALTEIELPQTPQFAGMHEDATSILANWTTVIFVKDKEPLSEQLQLYAFTPVTQPILFQTIDRPMANITSTTFVTTAILLSEEGSAASDVRQNTAEMIKTSLVVAQNFVITEENADPILQGWVAAFSLNDEGQFDEENPQTIAVDNPQRVQNFTLGHKNPRGCIAVSSRALLDIDGASRLYCFDQKGETLSLFQTLAGKDTTCTTVTRATPSLLPMLYQCDDVTRDKVYRLGFSFLPRLSLN